METRTLSLAASSLISAISPEKSASGPEITLTDSPIENCARVRGRSAVSRWRRRATSTLDRGIGFVREPREPRQTGGWNRFLRGADEAGDAGGVLDESPRVVGHLHVDQDVAGHGPLLGLDLLA